MIRGPRTTTKKSALKKQPPSPTSDEETTDSNPSDWVASPMPQLIAYVGIATIVLTIAAAAYQGLPILHAFAPIRTYPGLYFNLAMLAVACLLASMQFRTDVTLLGQAPIVWGSLVALVYAWVCIGYQLRKAWEGAYQEKLRITSF
jgi:hypothetical protein